MVSTENLKSKKGAFVTEWDPATGAMLRTRKIHNKPVTAMVVRWVPLIRFYLMIFPFGCVTACTFWGCSLFMQLKRALSWIWPQ